ncbi:MAG: hypothetical protein OXB89_09350, partial [Anaerolineaceae bacterium]|nr:hypothetical protein [Anaerolineaceae bacterium]
PTQLRPDRALLAPGTDESGGQELPWMKRRKSLAKAMRIRRSESKGSGASAGRCRFAPEPERNPFTGVPANAAGVNAVGDFAQQLILVLGQRERQQALELIDLDRRWLQELREALRRRG